jgi:DNA-binding response OmpR family regulator
MHEDSEHVSVALKPHLLVVDNKRGLCLLISQYLERGGFLFSAAHTRALGAHGACGNFQLIIMDVMLPDCKAFDVLRDLRKQLTPPVLI